MVYGSMSVNRVCSGFWFGFLVQVSGTGSGLILRKVSLKNIRIQLLLLSVYDYHPPVPPFHIFCFYFDTSLLF